MCKFSWVTFYTVSLECDSVRSEPDWGRLPNLSKNWSDQDQSKKHFSKQPSLRFLVLLLVEARKIKPITSLSSSLNTPVLRARAAQSLLIPDKVGSVPQFSGAQKHFLNYSWTD